MSTPEDRLLATYQNCRKNPNQNVLNKPTCEQYHNNEVFSSEHVGFFFIQKKADMFTWRHL